MELSGGQKSLVAIALVLAQVMYHPFPLYIFDEVGTMKGWEVDRRGAGRRKHGASGGSDQRRDGEAEHPSAEHLAPRVVPRERGNADPHQTRVMSTDL